MTDRKDRIKVHIDGKVYNVVGGEFREMLNAVKQVVGRRFVSELKVWELPGQAEDVQHQLSISGYELEGGTPIAPEAQATAAAPATANDRIRLKVGEYALAVVGGSFQEMLDTVKKIPGRRFNGQEKVWEIQSDPALVKGLIEQAGFQLEGAEQIPLDAVPPMAPPPDAPTASPPTYEPPNFQETTEAPPYEPPDFGDTSEAPPYEPPDWWDDDQMPPPVEPPAGWDDDLDAPPPDTPPAALPPEPPDFDAPPTASPAASPPAATPSSSGDRIRIRIGDSPFVVTGGDFRAMLDTIKKIPGRRFNGQDKVWEIPDDVTLDSVDQAIVAAGFMLLPG